eukprot:TRINITY_DN7570_c3_g1_i1.p1 TRINITY_DN7570_c3_g1~~TRINITY_DN7570_c3_g1_i1.p1  ORF type:complete len:1240 (+),score=513.92 TRINITY_DN7570_c3_g1_i1:94-3720(+)
MPKRPNRTAAAAAAAVLRKALKPKERGGGLGGMFARIGGVDEDKIYESLAAVQSQLEWAYVCQEYQKQFGSDLYGDMSSDLEKKEMEKCVQILTRKGVDMKKGAEEPPEREEASPAEPPPGGAKGSEAAQEIAKTLLKAMDRWGTDEDAIFEALGQVEDQKMWGEVIESFRVLGANFNGGNLLRSLEDELSGSDMQKCKVVLLGKGVLLKGGGGDKTDVATGSIADELYEAMSGWGTDEKRILDALRTVRSQKEWESVREQFRKRYPDFKGGNLLRALESELSKKDMQKAREALQQGGVRLEGDPERGAEQAVADQLYKAMKGLGTDEKAVYEALAAVKTQAMWKAVKVEFKKEYPDYKDGDLIKAMKGDLNQGELKKCADVLAANGVTYDETAKPPSKSERAAAVAEILFRAMKGMGTNEAEIFLALGGVKSQEAWEAVQEQYKVKHGDFYDGDLLKSLRQELDKGDLERCKSTLLANGVVMDGGSDAEVTKQMRAETIAEMLFKSMKGLGTDEEAIFDALRGVEDQEMWEMVQAAFMRDHPKFNKGDLRASLYDELGKTGDDIDKCRRILQHNNVALEGEPGGEAAVRAAAVADALYRAMDGLGTDEAAIFSALGSLQTQEDWNAVKQRFKKRYSNSHKGDLVASLRSELSEKDMQKCADVLLRNGIDFHGDKAVSPEKVAGSAARAIHAALQGMGTDEEAVYAVLRTVRTQEMWQMVQDEFRREFPGREGGDLIRALKAEMSSSELEKCRAALRVNGVLFEGAVGGPPEIRARHAVGMLYKAMKGLGTDEAAVYSALEALQDASEWHMCCEHFRQVYPDWHNGELLTAMRSDLSKKELKKCEEILTRKGADLYDPSKGAKKPPAAAPAAAAPAAPPPAAAPAAPPGPKAAAAATVDKLQATVAELGAAVGELRQRVAAAEGERAQFKAVAAELERELELARRNRGAGPPPPAAPPAASVASQAELGAMQQRLRSIEEVQRELLAVVDGQGAGLAAMAAAQNSSDQLTQSLQRQVRSAADQNVRVCGAVGSLAARVDAQGGRADAFHRVLGETARAVRALRASQEELRHRQQLADNWSASVYTAAYMILPIPPPPGSSVPPAPLPDVNIPDVPEGYSGGGGDPGASAVALEAAELRRSAASLAAEIASGAGSPRAGWARHTDAATGRAYWHQANNGVSVWEHPNYDTVAGAGYRAVTNNSPHRRNY